LYKNYMPPQPDASSTKAKVAIDGKNPIIVSRGARQVGHDGSARGTGHKNAPRKKNGGKFQNLG
jgi:hypothetical protein